MQIHELGSFAGTPGAGDYLPIDNGSQTSKIEMAAAVEALAEPVAALAAEGMKVLVLTRASFSSLPITINEARITSEMVVINSELGNPSAQTGDWTVTTSNGSLTVAGAISGSTTLKLYLARSK